MQLNFLQEDLLEHLQKDGRPAALPLASSPKTSANSKPQQTSLLMELPVSAPQKKKPAASKPAIKKADVASNENKAPSAFKTISEAADILGVPAYVLRFWESQFPQIHPTKSRGGRRYYRPEDMEVLTTIKELLYKQGYTIKGARKAFSQVKQEAQLASQPVAVQTPVASPQASAKPPITQKQRAQLAAIRSELLDLRAELGAYLSH